MDHTWRDHGDTTRYPNDSLQRKTQWLAVIRDER